jgi:hypothetical protein
MAKQKAQTPGLGVTAAGIVEAVTQDFDLSMERVKDAVEAVEEKLGVRRPKPKAKAATSMKLKAAKVARRPKGKKK